MVFGSCLVSAGAPGQARNDEQAKAIAAFGKFRVGLHFDELQAGDRSSKPTSERWTSLTLT